MIPFQVGQVPLRIDSPELQALPRALPEPISVREGYDSPPIYLTPEMASYYTEWAVNSLDPNIPPTPKPSESLKSKLQKKPSYENNAYGDFSVPLPESSKLEALIKQSKGKNKKKLMDSLKNGKVDWSAFIRDIGDALGMIKGGEFVENPKAGRSFKYESPGRSIGRFAGSPVAYTSGTAPWTGA